MRVPCPGRQACTMGVQQHVHNSNGMVEFEQPSMSIQERYPIIRVPECTCGVEKRDLAGLEDHADDCAMRLPDDRALRARVRQLEAKAHLPVDLRPAVRSFIEQHPVVRELRAKVEEQQGQIAELERKVCELWRRAM